MVLQEHLPFPPTENDEELFDQIGLESTFGEAATAAFQMENMNDAMGILEFQRNKQKAQDQGGPLIDPQELNRIFPDLNQKFKNPTNRASADILAKRQREKQRLQNIVASGPRGALANIGTFAAAMLPHVIDPIEAAAGFAIGAGLGHIARGTALGARLTFLRAGVNAPLRAQAARVGTEALVGNTIIEAGVIGPGRVQELEDYTAGEAFFSTVGGAFGAAGLGVGVRVATKAARFGTSKLNNLVRRTGPAATDLVNRTGVSQAVNGKKIDVAPLVDLIADEQRVKPNGVAPGERFVVEFSPLKNNSPKDRRFFGAVKGQIADFKEGDHLPISNDFGDRGVHLTDNPNIANGVAATRFDNELGAVFEIKTGDLNLIDLDARFVGKARETIRPFVETVFPKRQVDKILDVLKGKEVIESIKGMLDNKKLSDDFIDTINERFELSGFDGFRHQGIDFIPNEGRHNAIFVFDPKKVEQVAMVDGERNIVPKPLADEANTVAKRQLSREARFDFDEKAQSEFDSIAKEEQTPTPGSREVLKEQERLIKQVQEANKEGIFDNDPEFKKDFDQLEAAVRDEQTFESLENAIENCVGNR